MSSLLQNTIFGNNKYRANTFIGGVAATLNTPALIAARIGVQTSRIKSFKIVGSDIEFAVIGGTYNFGNGAFNGNTDITYFDDRSGLIVDSPFGNAFYNAVNLQWFNLPKITRSGYRLAAGCTSLHTISFGSIMEISSECFTGCINLVNVGNSFLTAQRIGNVAFRYCAKLTELNLPNVGLCNLNNSGGMFGDMTELVTLYAPNLTLDPISNIVNGSNMLENCSNLENITLTSLNFIPRWFVRNCIKLKNLNLPNATSGNLFEAFHNTPLLEVLGIPKLNTFLQVTYRAFLNSGVKHIDFSNVTDLTMLTNETFQGTTRLETLDIRGGITAIGASASVNNNVFNLMKTGVTITANIYQKTINAGSPEPDLQFAISNRAATVVYQGIIIVGAYGANFQKSTDNGVSFASGGFQSSTRGLSISANNKYILLAHNSGVVLSSDFGKSFTNTTLAGATYFCVSVSDTGQYMLASASSGSTYLSTDYGVTWNLAVYGGRRDCFVSGTGQYMLATNIDGASIVRSIDYGVSWTPITGNGIVSAVCCSDDGQYITAVSSGSTIKVSNDGGLTWTSKTAYGNFAFPKVAMSIDGKYQTVIGQNKFVHISSDFGVTWTVKTNTFNNVYYSCLDMSKDGKIQVIAVSGGYIYSSSDFGMTWTQKGTTFDYQAIAISN